MHHAFGTLATNSTDDPRNQVDYPATITVTKIDSETYLVEIYVDSLDYHDELMINANEWDYDPQGAAHYYAANVNDYVTL